MSDDDMVYEYRVVDNAGGTVPMDVTTLTVGAAAFAGVLWLDETQPGLSPHSVERRPLRIAGWERVRSPGEAGA